MTRTFKTRITSRACENFGAVDYTITDEITEQADDGLNIVTIARGVSEGARVDQRSERFYPGGNMDKAAAYRLQNGYTEVL